MCEYDTEEGESRARSLRRRADAGASEVEDMRTAMREVAQHHASDERVSAVLQRGISDRDWGAAVQNLVNLRPGQRVGLAPQWPRQVMNTLPDDRLLPPLAFQPTSEQPRVLPSLTSQGLVPPVLSQRRAYSIRTINTQPPFSIQSQRGDQGRDYYNGRI